MKADHPSPLLRQPSPDGLLRPGSQEDQHGPAALYDIAAYDKKIEELGAEKYPATAILRQVDGVGPVTALTYVLTLFDPHRFASSRDVGSFLGLRPRRDQSGDSDPNLRITKAGDVRLRVLLVQCAHHVLGPFGKDSDLRRWGLKLKERGGRAAHRKAAIAVARKLAVLLHALWRNNSTYEPLRLGGDMA